MSTESRRERPHPPREPRGDRPAASAGSPRLEAVVDAIGGISGRLIRVWKALPSERRLAALAAVGLFVTLFLPWYQETVIARGVTSLRSLSESMTGWGAFSFVEAAVLLVAAGVLLLLFVRAEGQPFHAPGGDGTVVTVAGGWTCLLIVWRMFDKEGTAGHGLYSTTSGIEWGIFVALAVAGLLTYAGLRIRRAHEPEPALPGERRARRRRERPGAAAEETTPSAVAAQTAVPRGSARTAASPAATHAATSPPAAESTASPARDRSASAVEYDIEETWLQLENDRSRRGPPPPPVRRVAGSTEGATARLDEAADPTTGLEPPTDVTSPLAPPPAAPVPRRRRPRSISLPPDGEDPITVRRERRD